MIGGYRHSRAMLLLSDLLWSQAAEGALLSPHPIPVRVLPFRAIFSRYFPGYI
jgi:hypothetical protein